MNVYVIYKFSNLDFVQNTLNTLKSQISNISFFFFKPSCKKHWHRKAKEKIRTCNQVIFFDNVSNNKNENVKNIKWELKLAEKYNKKIVVFKNDNNDYSEKLYETDYSEEEINYIRYKTYNVSFIKDYFEKETKWNIQNNLLHEKLEYSNEYNELLFEQYKLMVQTSEKLMERRHSTGNLYTTICSALLAFLGASFAFKNLLISGIIALLSGLIIIVLCINWRLSLSAYDLNNRGKFEVINQIEKNLPADMFECEYRYNTLNGIRSYSMREKKLPIIFISFGITLCLLSIVLITLGIIFY